jgi:hypothetical protein
MGLMKRPGKDLILNEETESNRKKLMASFTEGDYVEDLGE